MTKTTCAACGGDLESVAATDPCPWCGSTSRSVGIVVADVAAVAATGYVNIRSQSGEHVVSENTGRKRLAYERITGEFPRRGGEGFVTKEQTFDRRNDIYSERVVDLATGEVL